jgi:dipeptidyl aminopeptidase/acylaminoacyl peptidase
MIGKRISLAFLLACAAVVPVAARNIAIDDMFAERDVTDPQISADGNWIAYTVDSTDVKADESYTHIWMTRFDGSRTIQLTNRAHESESTPRFSPDGKSIAFLSDRTDGVENDAAVDQVWLMDRAGGEAQRITDFKGAVSDIVWSPDGKKLALIVNDAKSDEQKLKKADDDSDSKKPKPIQIDRFYFKEDVTGYLGKERQHLYVFDLASRKSERIVPGEFNEYEPAWSPDGKSIAFVSKRARVDFDRDENWDVYVVAAKANSQPRALTTYPGIDNEPDWSSYPAWSPDGKTIAYIQGGPLKMIEYAVHHLAVVPASGGTPKVLTASLDRNVQAPTWSADGKTIHFIVEDDRAKWLASIPSSGGAMQHIAGARNAIYGHTATPQGREALLIGTPNAPMDVYAFDGKSAPRQISHQNEWLKGVTVATTTETSFKSKDGTEVHGYIVTPPGWHPGMRLPAILSNHGGPVDQWDLTFDHSLQTFAAQGYAVIVANPRGSSGRGEKYSSALYADWAGPAVPDVLAAVDDAVKRGIADPNRMCVEGWSYGAILTNYVIASDTRFKCAISGAGMSNILAGYGTDEYVRDYEAELGVPWKNTATWLKNSFPFLHADRIKTPTLFMGGEKDFNVPLLNTEQMYQAEKSLGLESQLIIYPGQFHGLTQPSDLKDRMVRDVAWINKHLKGGK